MKKSILTAAIAAALVAPGLSSADVTMYGKLRVATQVHDRSESATAAGVPTNNDSAGMEDHASRLGVKGFEELGGGLRAVFQMEFGVPVGSGFNGNSTNNSFGALRNSYVGLAGDFGTFFMGRHDTPLKMSTAKLDFFMDTMADNDDEGAFRPNPAINPTRLSTRGVGLFDGKRVGGVIALVSPKYFGFTMATALVQGNASDTFAKADNFSGASSTSLTYHEDNEPFYGSIAYESIDARSLPSSAVGTTSIASNEVYNKWRFGVGILNFNNVSLSFIYEHGDETAFLTGADTSAWQLSGAYDLMPGIRVKGMYGEFDGDGTVGIAGFNTWALGLEYSLSNRTDIQVLYRAKDVNNTTKVGGLNLDDNVFAIQLDHSF